MQRLNKISGIKKYPEWFSEEEINTIFFQISKCNDYWKKKGYADWGRFFKFDKAILLSGLTFYKFLDFIKKGFIKYDFRLGVFKSGPKIGKNHDHGSGFRILKGDLGKVFTITKLD